MAWRSETRLATLPDTTEFEVRCKMCGKYRYLLARELKAEGRFGQFYIDQIQAALTCRDRRCGGGQVMAITHDHLMEGFVAGMP